MNDEMNDPEVPEWLQFRGSGPYYSFRWRRELGGTLARALNSLVGRGATIERIDFQEQNDMSGHLGPVWHILAKR